MTGKELYDKIGGDYDKIIQILHSDALIFNFAKMFLKDASFSNLKAAMESQNYEEAFKAAHSLKGVCLNMSYDKIGNLTSEITEMLRNGSDIEGAKAKFPEIEEAYNVIVEEISKL